MAVLATSMAFTPMRAKAGVPVNIGVVQKNPKMNPMYGTNAPKLRITFWIRSSEEIEPAPADEVLGWEIVESL